MLVNYVVDQESAASDQQSIDLSGLYEKCSLPQSGVDMMSIHTYYLPQEANSVRKNGSRMKRP